MNFDVVIIGGGVAGISAALQISQEGYSYALIEKSFFLGGKSLQLCCKASDRCNKCGACTADHKIREIFKESYNSFFIGSFVNRAEERDGNFILNVKRMPSGILSENCTKCGKCVEVCPVEGKAVNFPPFSSFPQIPFIDKEKCLRSFGNECSKCADACKYAAIDYSQKEEETEINTKTVVIAVGLEHFDPSQKSSYHYGIFKNIISGQELEEKIRKEGVIVRPSDGEHPSSIAFIQCAGSRDPKNANPYCSQICCLFAMRSSLHIKEDLPDTRIKIFYMDLQADCKEEMEIVERCKKSIEFERSMPGVIVEKEDGRIGLTYESLEKGKNIEEDFDLVVLSTGIAPSSSNREIAELFGLEIDEAGFIKKLSPIDKTRTKNEKIFIAGGCEGPKNAVSSIMQGIAAGRNAVTAIKRENKVA